MSEKINEINWAKIKLVIFDVDGTLYRQSPLRKKMILELLKHYIFRPKKWYQLKVLTRFRSERAKLGFKNVKNVNEAQYQVCSERLNVPVRTVKQVVEKWIYTFPLPYLKKYLFCDLEKIFALLKRNNVLIGIFSDYPACEKINQLNLYTDIIVSGVDPEIDLLKPDPKGINYILDYFKIDKKSALLIGDRDELDGEAARRAGIDYLIINRNDQYYYQKLYKYLRNTALTGNKISD